jgi:hypothetical protein
MNGFHFTSKYFWLMGMLVTVVNFIIFRKKAQKHIQANPQLKAGYVSLFRGYLIWFNMPWIIMGIGCTIGGVPSVWHYFRPRDGNPYVLGWFCSIFLLWVVGTFWLFFRGGAETLAHHPGAIELKMGLHSKEITNPTHIKMFWLLCLSGGIIGIAMMLCWDPPIPPIN